MAIVAVMTNSMYAVHAQETDNNYPVYLDEDTMVDVITDENGVEREVVMHRVEPGVTVDSLIVPQSTVDVEWLGSTDGLGTNYKTAIQSKAESLKLHLGQRGSLYYASRQADSGGHHIWYCKVQLTTVYLYYGVTIYTAKAATGEEYVTWCSDPWKLDSK